MKTFAAVLVCLIVAGCASSSNLTFRPKGSSEDAWRIVTTKTGNGVKVMVNDSLVVDESLGIFARSGDFSGKYLGHNVTVHFIYDNGFLGIGAGWETTVYIDGELAGRSKL
jgi:hypothetical protein